MDEYAFGSSPGGDIEKYRALVHTSRGVRPPPPRHVSVRHGVSAAEDQRVGEADVKNVGEEAPVARSELHVAVVSAGAVRSSSGKASSQTSRM